MHRDFNAPDNADRPADSSAAMIAASAFLLLAQIEQSQSPANTSGSEYWLESAMQVSERSMYHLTHINASFSS